MEENELIDFRFEWTGNGFNELAPNVKAMANKLVELNMIRVEQDLNEKGNIVVLHAGVCKKVGLVECLTKGMVNENIYNYRFNVRPYESLKTICEGRADSKFNYCQMSSCPIMAAGYIWYLKHRKENMNQEIQQMENNLTDNDIYNRNYDELKKADLNPEVEKLVMPLATPSIKGLRCAFVGEEGTDKEKQISKVANYLYRIGKISSNRVINLNLGANFELLDDRLYSIVELDTYLEAIANNDDFSNSAESGRKINKGNIKKIVSQTKGKYIIVNCTSSELKRFLETNSKLPYVFDNVITFEDYKDEEILKLFEQSLPQYHKNIMNVDERLKFLEYLKKNRKFIPFKNQDLSSFLAGYVSRKNEIELPKERYEETTVEEMFENLIGMNNVKKQLRELNEFLKLQKRLENLGKTIPSFNLHMMFLGNAGTGKTTVARMIAKTLFDLGYTKENKCVEVASKDLIAAFTGQTPLKTARVINSAMGGVLFIDEAYALAQTTGNSGAEAINTLVKAMEDNKGDLVVIFAGYSKEMQEFIRANSGIQSRIGYTFEFADYTEDELFEIFKLKASKIGLSIDESAEIKLREIINFGRNRKNFGNGRYIDNILQKTLTKQSELNLDDENVLVLTEKSIPTIEEIITQSSGERHPDKIEESFSEIIGMEKIKKEIIALGKYAVFRDKLSKNAKNSLPDMRLHMLFSGDAGTGKTTMARALTEMLYNLGCIRINKLVEVERKDLVGRYIGETAPKTEKVIESALGGVLFIDEAYSLNPKDNGKDFGQEAIATLIKAMEDHKDELVVIFAGYTKEMKEFVNSNSGIASRIGYTFEFENYKAEELYEIFEVKCKKYSLKINDKVKEKVMSILKYFSSVENFGNGRFVDKLLQEILIKHSTNEKLDKNIDTIMEEDIPTIEEMAEKTFNNEEHAALPSDVDEESRRWTAIHEIGHALIEYLHNGDTTLKVINVVPEGNGTLGYVLHTPVKEKLHLTKRDYLNRIDVLLAGRAAEDVILGKVASGCWNDLEKAANIVTKMLKECGMSETLGLLSTKNIDTSIEMSQYLDKEKKHTLDECYEETKTMLKEHRELFDKVINELMEKGTMSGEEFLKVVKDDSNGK